MKNNEDKDEPKRYEYTRNCMIYTTPNIIAAILRKDTESIKAYYEDGSVKEIIIENEETTNRK